MKITDLLLVGSLLCCFSPLAKADNGDSLTLRALVQETKAALQLYGTERDDAVEKLSAELASINQLLENGTLKADPAAYLDALQRKLALRDELYFVEEIYQLGVAKTRYRKGLELIKIMYEKTLGLDHHFHSLKTYQNVVQLSNPNSYPAFQQSKDLIQERLKKRNAVQLPALLTGNPLLSATFTLVASVIGEEEPKQKEQDLEKIACILDFTVRMTADLNLIYYETEFLKGGNDNLKEECVQLFKDYTKIIGYKVELDVCRSEDDWETIYDLLDKFVLELEADAAKAKDNPAASRELMKGIANLGFSIDRLLDFLEKYNAFIAQGEKYYQKFEVIVSNYQNETVCAGQLPVQFSTLKEDIRFSILKFKEAYNIAELTGSKLKDLLYGVSD